MDQPNVRPKKTSRSFDHGSVGTGAWALVLDSIGTGITQSPCPFGFLEAFCSRDWPRVQTVCPRLKQLKRVRGTAGPLSGSQATSWTLELPIKMGYHQPSFWGSNPFLSWNFEGSGWELLVFGARNGTTPTKIPPTSPALVSFCRNRGSVPNPGLLFPL